MALHWFIDSRARLIAVTAEGPVSRAEIDGLLDGARRRDGADGQQIDGVHREPARIVRLVIPRQAAGEDEGDGADRAGMQASSPLRQPLARRPESSCRLREAYQRSRRCPATAPRAMTGSAASAYQVTTNSGESSKQW